MCKKGEKHTKWLLVNGMAEPPRCRQYKAARQRKDTLWWL